MDSVMFTLPLILIAIAFSVRAINRHHKRKTIKKCEDLESFNLRTSVPVQKKPAAAHDTLKMSKIDADLAKFIVPQ